MTSMDVSQQTIAQALNVSVATVSRSLRNHPAISSETRARVAEAAMRLGYKVPDGRTITRGRPRRDNGRAGGQNFTSLGLAHLAVICQGGARPDSAHFVVQFRILQGMSAAARAHHATLHIEYLSDEEFNSLPAPATWPAVLREKFVSGVILLGTPRPETVAALQRVLPCICFQRSAGAMEIDTVSEDNYNSMCQLFTHLMQLGHRRIGMVDFGYRSHSYRARLGAFMQCLLEWNLPVECEDFIFPGRDDLLSEEAKAAPAAEHVIARRRAAAVTAWICQNDYQGYLLLRHLHKSGLRVPEDISLCGFDHFPPPEGLAPLTSIDGAFEAMGSAAISRLLARIKSPTMEPANILLNTNLCLGKSTGPAAVEKT